MLDLDDVMGVVKRWVFQSPTVSVKGDAIRVLEGMLHSLNKDGGVRERRLGDLSAKVGSLDGEVAALGRRLDYFIDEVSETARDQVRRAREAEGLVEDIGDSEPLPFVAADSVRVAVGGLADQLIHTALAVARDRLRGEMASVTMRQVQGEEE